MRVTKLEYIWIDGTTPTNKLRSKTKLIPYDDWLERSHNPEWGFDGSSTNQAIGNFSDCIIKPVKTFKDPTRDKDSFLVMCEVFNADRTPHKTNHRHKLVELYYQIEDQDVWMGIEQEYTMYKGQSPAGWPEAGYPPSQGPFYCGVGIDEIYGREIVEEHMNACNEAGILLSGINAEVMPGQWEYQVGPLNPIDVSDHLHVSRWLLCRIAEKHGIRISFAAKPAAGDWNGAGCHTNFSTAEMREEGGLEAIKKACEKLGQNVEKHLPGYGHGLEQRLTGDHETCSYKDFRWGIADRGASIRIPAHVAEQGRGYLEDRRPCANIDPYIVSRLMCETICL